MPTPPTPTCLFFARVADPSLLDLVEFYREDVQIIESLGYIVEPFTKNRQVIRLSRRSRPSIAYCWWHHSALPTIAYLRLLGVPVVVTGALHLSDPDAQTRRDRLRHGLTRIAARLATVNLAISDVEKHDFGFLSTGRCIKTPLGVETDFYVPGSDDRVNAGVTIGQLNPVSIRRKGIDVAIAAVPYVARIVSDYEFHVIGPTTPEGAALIDDLVAASDPSRIVIHAEVSRERKRELLQRSRVYLQPSQFEGFGLAALEALSCGVPVVHSGRGSLPEVVGPAGIAVAERTPEAIGAAVVACLTSAPTNPTMEHLARRQAESLSRSHRQAMFASIFDGVLTRHPAPPQRRSWPRRRAN